MHILLIGSGGREHALAWKLRQSAKLDRLSIIGGNAGINQIADTVDIASNDFDAIVKFCKSETVDLVIPGPEAPLVAGIVDTLTKHNIRTFGPTAYGARLEGSKSFTKNLCRLESIPTASYEVFSSKDAALNYLKTAGTPIVIKADGLAAGKGVTVAKELHDAEKAIYDIFSTKKAEGNPKTIIKDKVVIEECLFGTEMSAFYLCNGTDFKLLGTAQDYKRAYDGDKGPNTGGMGAISPSPLEAPALMDRIENEIIGPTLNAMKKRGHPYTGVLYAGLMITDDGPKLIEYNCRFGDPECQVLMMRLETDIIDLMTAHLKQDYTLPPIKLSNMPAITIVATVEGYPGKYKTGEILAELKSAETTLKNHLDSNHKIFHAGTIASGNEFLTNGGRVFCATAKAPTLTDASERAYSLMSDMIWTGGYYRRDIGADIASDPQSQ